MKKLNKYNEFIIQDPLMNSLQILGDETREQKFKILKQLQEKINKLRKGDKNGRL